MRLEPSCIIIEVQNLLLSCTVIIKFNCSGHLRKPKNCSAFFCFGCYLYAVTGLFCVPINLIFSTLNLYMVIFPMVIITFNWSIIFVVYIILFNWFIRNCKLSSFEYHLVMFSNTILPSLCKYLLIYSLVLLLFVFIYIFTRNLVLQMLKNTSMIRE
jgi:hypothetical protein